MEDTCDAGVSPASALLRSAGPRREGLSPDRERQDSVSWPCKLLHHNAELWLVQAASPGEREQSREEQEKGEEQRGKKLHCYRDRSVIAF